ncbi:OprO/OprP family phosphate-selective porin [Fulvivirga ulvae]|uniref:porin n=1 Tax=Fulvivirga ulvae TaxID=2904245 RepID=UPI001F300FAD|nr:porin [Fulvivirga ulvae]UII34482.1 OprO/OprP family phosphate-selective porin [Fulvivirga ulvae]
MNKLKYVLLTLIFFPLLSGAQDTTSNSFGKGIQIVAKDSSFSMKFSTRFQTLYDGGLNLETDKWNDQLMIRRARLKFDGFAYDPRLEYKIELAVSNRDNGKVASESNLAANIVLDAVLKYQFAPGWEVWFGQTKLPGNRERVISSQKLQFVDRSQVNSKYNIDRGQGIQIHHEHTMGKAVLREIGSIAMGEGRNLTIDNIGGYEYTGRIEYLPFGKFTGNGDYFGSDLKREKTPKLSIGVTYDQNNNAPRERGFAGDFLSEHHDLKTYFVDAMFKYQGFSSMFEYADKRTDGSPVTSEGAFYTGTGLNLQMGYLFDNNFEIAGRYTDITPEKVTGYEAITELTLGVSKYFAGHSLKIQSDLTHVNNEFSDDELRYRFQVELAF